MSRVQVLSLAGLLTLAAGFGLWMGLRAIPPGETEIINAAAARYVAETGGRATDCFARPSDLPRVRLVVICEPAAAGTPWVLAVDRHGARVDIDRDILAGEPLT